MNRAVEEVYHSFSRYSFGQGLLFLMEHEPDLCKKNREIYKELDELPNPRPLVKYCIRRYWIFKRNDQKFHLYTMRNAEDPYETITFWKFTGQFKYDDEEQVYKLVGQKVEGSRFMGEVFKKIEKQRVRKRWKKIKKYLRGNNGEEPALDYSFDE